MIGFVLVVIGVAAIVAGLSLWSVPAALVVAGLALAAAGLFVDFEKKVPE